MNLPRIWTNFPPVLRDAALLQEHVPDSPIILGNKKSPDNTLADAGIAFGQPDPEQVIALSGIRWVHLSTAGYTKYDRDDLRAALRSRGGILTNSSSVYSEPCAQHALAMMLGIARLLPQSLENQRKSKAWPAEETRASSALLCNQKALMVGFGAIGRRLAELLAPFRMEIVALRRDVRGDETVRVARMDQLDEFLPWADHVINLLPAARATSQLFDADRFRKMKRAAVFYNIGRGDTVDQTALRTMLETESLAGAYLDVMMPEPLPPHDPLWTTPNCYITPHTAGGFANEEQGVVKHFVENLLRFKQQSPLRDRIV